jgi:hypothetical protein
LTPSFAALPPFDSILGGITQLENTQETLHCLGVTPETHHYGPPRAGMSGSEHSDPFRTLRVWTIIEAGTDTILEHFPETDFTSVMLFAQRDSMGAGETPPQEKSDCFSSNNVVPSTK